MQHEKLQTLKLNFLNFNDDIYETLYEFLKKN